MLNGNIAISAAAEAVQSETSLKLRILLADDHFLIAETLSMLLASHFDVVGVIIDAELIASAVARLRPEVALLALTMPGLSGLDAAQRILEQTPSTKIMFLTMHANPAILKKALRVGASAYIVKACYGLVYLHLAVRRQGRHRKHCVDQSPV
jgi:DNA-binding NarL/FixJ family response regulator